MEILSVSKARSRLSELHRQIIYDHEQVILTHKIGNAALISMDEWESYKETMRLLNDKKALKALAQSFEDHDAGKSVGKSAEEIFSDMTV